jgi:hypothetical protein
VLLLLLGGEKRGGGRRRRQGQVRRWGAALIRGDMEMLRDKLQRPGVE